MKKTEQAWRNILGGGITFIDMTGRDGYIPCTVTWDEPEWEDVKVNADPQSPNYVWYKDECGVTRQVPRDAEIIAVFRRRKPEPEVLEGSIKRCQKYLIVAMPVTADDRTDLLNKRVKVEVIE